MSLFKKTLASFGIGSAKVDSILQQEVLYPGQAVNVTVHVYGGSTVQEIDNIEMKLYCRYIKEIPANQGRDDRNSNHMRRIPTSYTLAHWSLPYSFTIGPGETRDFEVELNVPWNTPVTIGDSKVWLDTGLNIALSKDPSDTDILTVRPEPLLDGIFAALEECGLRIRQVECEAVDGFDLPFVQEFEFVPTTGPFHGRWRELEMVSYRGDEQLQMWFEVDRHRKGARGMMASLLGRGKLKRHLTIPVDTPAKQAGKLVVEYLDNSS
ncbi:sporulation protein [Vibrio hepatarius]|uniref:sporulation protein n=1 Tax=Vibrio hepatarius TaxID=171383 RepID=UPI001C082E77|nr:sporulation protein [Vibrio hepatarius]MBU2897624.1 sporulation protein [Vibrio hepatarius]